AEDLRLAIEAVQADSSLHQSDCESLVMVFGKNADGSSGQHTASKFPANLCGFRLDPQDAQAPFSPGIQTETFSSPGLEPLTNEQGALLREVLPAIKMWDLRASWRCCVAETARPQLC